MRSATGGAYTAYLQRNADSVYGKDRDSLDFYGSHWAGPYAAPTTAASTAPWNLLNAAP